MAKPDKIDEHQVRKGMVADLQKNMDDQVMKRKHRFDAAAANKDTDRQWNLVAAAFEEANIIYHGLTGKEATKAKGRSNISFKNSKRDALTEKEKLEEEHDLEEKVKWLRNVADKHIIMSNELTNISRRMKVNERRGNEYELHDKNIIIND